jgi:hypothetical protein
MPYNPNIARLKKMLSEATMTTITATTITATTVKPTALTVSGVQTHTNASGAYINGKNSVTKQVTFTGASANVDSGAIYIPGNSLITKLTVVCVTASAQADGNITIQAGTTAGGDDYAAAVIFETGTSVNGGVGTSTDTALATALTGDAPLVQRANSACWCSGAAELHMRVVSSGGAFTGGAFAFIVEFDYAGGN